MDYSTTFSAVLALRSRDDRILELGDVLRYEIAERNLIGDAKGSRGTHTWSENRLVLSVRQECEGYVESALSEVVGRVATLSDPQLAAFRDSRPWLIIRLLDAKFVEVHFSHEAVSRLAAVGLAVSVENHTHQAVT